MRYNMEFIHDLSDLFKNKSTSYKFFWFLAIIDELQGTAMPNDKILFKDLVVGMIARAWKIQTLEDIKLSEQDRIKRTCEELSKLLNISQYADYKTVKENLSAHGNEQDINKILKEYYKIVPFRLLTKWIKYNTDKDTIIRSEKYENGCLYKINDEEEKSITINPIWKKYLIVNYNSLVEDTLVELMNYLKKRCKDRKKVTADLFRTNMECPFCNIDKKDIVLENDRAIAFYDKFPVTKGHILIITRRHTEGYFDLSAGELKAINDLVFKAKKLLDGRFRPDGYNIGVNVGEVAGQSIFHLHIHVIPRYKGDTENPKGGVRGVIPDKQSY